MHHCERFRWLYNGEGRAESDVLENSHQFGVATQIVLKQDGAEQERCYWLCPDAEAALALIKQSESDSCWSLHVDQERSSCLFLLVRADVPRFDMQEGTNDASEQGRVLQQVLELLGRVLRDGQSVGWTEQACFVLQSVNFTTMRLLALCHLCVSQACQPTANFA